MVYTMSKLSKLMQVTEEERKAILKHYNIDERELEENVQRLKEWVHQSEHLPKNYISDDGVENKYKLCLVNSKMSLERAKQSIEGYYRVRTLYQNEFFDKLMPTSEEYRLGKKFVKMVSMPKLSPDLCRISIYRLSDPEGEAYDAFLYEILVLMQAELHLMEDFYLSNIVIVDFADYCWKNLLKFTPTINQKLVDILNSVNLRVKAIHFLNIPNYIDQIIKVMKAFLPAKIMNKVHFHKTHETLKDHVPPEYLPSDYEGTEKSLDELYQEWCEQIEESEELFKKLLNAKSTKKIDLDPAQKDLFGIGVEGSFRQLMVD